MKSHAFLRIFLVYYLLSTGTAAFAFQVADGMRPAPVLTSKYIFYWGRYQCDLSEANGYKSRLALTPVAFRQMLVSAPKIWDGSALVKDFRFKLEGITVSTGDYLTQLAQLDAQIGPLAKSGTTLYIKELALSAGVAGSIILDIKDETEAPNTMYGNSPNQHNVYLNDYFLDGAVWGREDIYETSNRDYFTVSEFWQTIRQEPALEWKSYQKPLALRSEINFTSRDRASFSVVAKLEEETYGGMLANLETYRYMVHPGAIISLQLQTAEQYDLLFKKTMNIVADDDPRLRLRRKRDQHRLSIQWDGWTEKIEGLYLTNLLNPQGEIVPTDPAIAANTGISFKDDRQANWGKNKPEFSIDDEPVSGSFSFRVTMSDSTVLHINSNAYDADSVAAFFARKERYAGHLIVDSIQIQGYELPLMTFSIRMINMNDGLPARNDFETLRKLSGNTTRIKLLPPTSSASELTFRFELPEKSGAIFSIFEVDGWNSYEKNEYFPAGETIVKVPRSAFRNTGKHIAFLNTPFGVTEVSFVLD